jgi:membrane associated rhomboid family serine protease
MDQHGNCSISFTFTPSASRTPRRVSQQTTVSAIDTAGLAVGSTVEVHYLPKWPRWAFIESLTRAERIRASRDATEGGAGTAVYFIGYSEPTTAIFARKGTANGYGWTDGGDVTITAGSARFVAKRRRPFWLAESVDREFPLNSIANVEVFGNAVSFEVREPDQPVRTLKIWTVDATQAAEIAALLPETTTEAFSPAMAEAAAFDARLKALSASTPVTMALVAINCAVFVIAAALGAGVFEPNPAILLILGTDFTPLTVGGQWWRLLTSTFLHFGLFHVGFNMWALYVNGPLAERIFGGARYLLIYICAGLTGSIVSLWWHPVINSAGASGAIFGIFGALLAFFVRRKGALPNSVVKRYRTGVAVFIAINLLFGATYPGIDNAAHLGGLIGGFLLGFLLARPLDAEPASPVRERLSVVAIAIIVGVATLVSFVRSPSSDSLLAEMADRLPHASARITLVNAVTTFWGVRLGETRAGLEKSKGRPLKIEHDACFYRAAGTGNDDLVEVTFTPSGNRPTDVVAAVFYQGDRANAPPELPFIIGVTGDQLLERFHQPVWTRVPDNDSEYEMFESGLTAYLWHREVRRYGIQDFYRAPETP